jgi:hypothetical protein
MSVQYIILLDHHAILFRIDPPTYTRTPDGQWTCDYMHYRTTVPGPHPDGRMESARLMWILARILHPMPRLLVSLSLSTSVNNSCQFQLMYWCHLRSAIPMQFFLFSPRPIPVCYICRNRTTRPICNRCGARMFPVSRRPTSDQVNHCPVSSCQLTTLLACSVTPLLRLSPFSKLFITVLMSISGARTFFRKTRLLSISALISSSVRVICPFIISAALVGSIPSLPHTSLEYGHSYSKCWIVSCSKQRIHLSVSASPNLYSRAPQYTSP